jgi:hypothetical protein
MSEDYLDSVVFSKNVLEFVTVAKEYCAMIEGHSSRTIRQFIERMQKIFPLLYIKASLLPAINDEGLEETEKFVSEIDYNFLLNKLSSRIGRFDSYQEVFDAGMQYSEAPIEGSIAENICDIYQDVKDFLMNYRIGSIDAMESALVECQSNFENYWGQRLVNGLRAIHNLMYSNAEWNEQRPNAYSSEPEKPKGKGNWVSKHFDNYLEETENDGE